MYLQGGIRVARRHLGKYILGIRERPWDAEESRSPEAPEPRTRAVPDSLFAPGGNGDIARGGKDDGGVCRREGGCADAGAGGEGVFLWGWGRTCELKEREKNFENDCATRLKNLCAPARFTPPLFGRSSEPEG